MTLAGLVGLAGIVVTLLLAAPAGAMPSPYTDTGSIAAYDADGHPVVVGYYDRIGGLPTVSEAGDAVNSFLQWFGSPDGGPLPTNRFNPYSDVCSEHETWPYSTGAPTPDPPCWDVHFDPVSSTPGTYGILMPPSIVVGGGLETEVFDHWNVSNAITAGKCRTGDMGVGEVADQGGVSPGSGDPFPYGPEYRIWTDLNNNLGMGATIEAHYARVSPDTTAPFVTIAPSTDCAVVKQHSSTLVAHFSCQEPFALVDRGGLTQAGPALGSGVASCVGRDDAGEVANGDPVDTSTLGAHSFTVTTVDNAGNERSRTMHYTVEEINDAPTALQLSNTAIDENQPAGTAVGTLSTTDDNVGDTFTYSLVDGAGSSDNPSFAIEGDTLKTTASFDYETKSSYSIRVRTTDQGGKSFEQTFTISVGDVVEATLSPTTIEENQPIGTLVGQLSVDTGNVAAIWGVELVSGPGDTDNGSFAVTDSGINQTAHLVTAARFDYETKSTYTIRIGVRYVCSCISVEQSFTIHVLKADDAPTALALSNASVAEKQPAGTTVGTLSTTDQDAGDTFTYSLVDGDGSTDNGAFGIDGSTLRTAASFDYLAKRSYSIRVRSTDSGGKSTERAFNITVTDATPPTLVLPGDITVQATGPNGAATYFLAGYGDPTGSAAGVTCTPASGSTFPLGTTTVNCSVIDGAGLMASGMFKVTVTPAAATHFEVSASGAATAGSAAGFTVTALDQFDNTATGYTGTVHFTSTDANATLPANSTLSDGKGTFSATLKTAGQQTITATDTVSGSINGTSGSVAVSPAAASHFEVSASGAATAGSAAGFTVTALDQFDNTATGYTGTVHFTSTDANATLPANGTLSDGKGTFSATLKTAGQQTITATDTVSGSVTGTSNVILVVAPAASTTQTTVASVPNPALATQQVTLTATVRPAPDGGTVAFDDGTSTIAGCGSQQVNRASGIAVCQTSSLTVGAHSITAVYSGDPKSLGSTSSALAEKVIADTPQNLGNLTLQYVQSSAKYQALPRASQKLIDALANKAIASLANIVSHITPAQQAKLVAAYQQGVAGLKAQGWLTSDQASTLNGLASNVHA